MLPFLNRNNLVILLLAVGLGAITYRSSNAAGGFCLSPPFTPASAIQPVANSTAESRRAPDWQLKDLDGKPVKLLDFKGKVVVLNFWATWCPLCRKEIPALIALHDGYKDKGVVVIGVSMDQGGPSVVKPFAKRTKINYPLVMGDESTAAAYGNVQVIPTTFFIDRDGNIAGTHEGDLDARGFESAIKPLLEARGTSL